MQPLISLNNPIKQKDPPAVMQAQKSTECPFKGADKNPPHCEGGPGRNDIYSLKGF